MNEAIESAHEVASQLCQRPVSLSPATFSHKHNVKIPGWGGGCFPKIYFDQEKYWGESVSELMIKKKQLQETVHSTVLLGYFYLLYMLYSNLSCVYCC